MACSEVRDAYDSEHEASEGRPVSRRSIAVVLVVLLAAGAVGVGLYVRSASAVTPGVIAVAGDVRVDEYIVKAPSITPPTPDVKVGIPVPLSAAMGGARGGGGAPPMASRTPTVSGFLTDVLVAQGAHVTRGQVVARLDTTLLDLGIAQAKAASVRAHANVAVMDSNIDKLDDGRAKLITARAKILRARATLSTQYAKLLRTRASLEASITAVSRLIAQPGGPPPHVPPYPVILAGMKAGLVQLNKGLAQMKAGLAKIDSGLAQMRKALATIDKTRRQLVNARELLQLNADAQQIAIDIAAARRDTATITSPVDGIVTFATSKGTVAMVGAPIVKIRPDGSTHIDTFLTADQLVQVHVGTPVTVDFDSNPGGPIAGTIATVGDAAVVPPTAFPTSIVHMTRAVPVTVDLASGASAPPGTPVDVQILTNLAR